MPCTSPSPRPCTTAQTASLWNADRDSLNQFGERWSGNNPNSNPKTSDWRAQASALEAFLATY